MRIVTLERFAEPSRRCGPGIVGRPADRVEVCELPGPRNQPLDLLRRAPEAAAQWWRAPLPGPVKRRLLRACLATGGARLGALAMAPELWQRVRDGEVDAIACMSAKDFALARLLAEASGAPPVQALSRDTRYFGEFAFELLAVIPYAYWLHRTGRLRSTASTEDTRCLYYFSPHHEERPVRRRYVPITEYPVGERGGPRYDRKAFPARLDTQRWLAPPYRQVFANDRFRLGRELCVVVNKASSERYLLRGFSVNTIDPELLLAVVGRLRERFQVVYVRPRADDIVGDHQSIRETRDIVAVKARYPEVLTIQQLHSRNPDLSFNELQMMLFANCRRFVSVLGGGSYLASYFGGTNVVYARRGWEVSCGAYEAWFDRFSGARVVSAGTPANLLGAVERELLR